MSGHNRWSKIKHKKEASDSKRSKVWTKVIKEITISARLGGGEINGNPRLRTAVDKGRAVNMPNDTIERSIKKGTGDLEGVQLRGVQLRGLRPGRHGDAGRDHDRQPQPHRQRDPQPDPARPRQPRRARARSAWMFKKQGLIVYEKTAVDENALTDQAIELGAEDIRTEGEALVVVTEPKEFERIREGLKTAKAGAGGAKLPDPVSAEVTMVPQNVVRLTGKDAEAR